MPLAAKVLAQADPGALESFRASGRTWPYCRRGVFLIGNTKKCDTSCGQAC